MMYMICSVDQSHIVLFQSNYNPESKHFAEGRTHAPWRGLITFLQLCRSNIVFFYAPYGSRDPVAVKFWFKY